MLRPFMPTMPLAVASGTSTVSQVALRAAPQGGYRQVAVYNSGAVDVTIKFGDTSSVTCGFDTGDITIPAGALLVLTMPPLATHAAAITQAGTTTLRFTVGDGE